MVDTLWQVRLTPLTQADGDAWVIKLDAKGNVQWQKTYGGENDDVCLLHPADFRWWIHCGRLY